MECKKAKALLPLKDVEICNMMWGGILLIENSVRSQIPSIIKIIERDIESGKKWKLYVEDSSNGVEVLVGRKRPYKVALDVLPNNKLPEWSRCKEEVDKLDPVIQKLLVIQDQNGAKARTVVIVTTVQKLLTQAKNVQVLAFTLDQFRDWAESKDGKNVNFVKWLPNGILL